MSKRRLTDQQRSRIKKRQTDRIDKLMGDSEERERTQSGQVVARYSRHIDVKVLDGSHANQIIRCHARANIDSITVGDKVAWVQHNDNKGVVVAVLDRSSAILRPDGAGQLKPVAANIDQVFIVLAPLPEPHPNLIDRYLIAAENAGITAHLIINKDDLLNRDNDLSIFELIETYKNLGYTVFTLSCRYDQGVDQLKPFLVNKISIFAGQSGVGKSSLINCLIPGENVTIGELSHHVNKGKHTTTTAMLFDIPCGGQIIDSPGIREFHLTHLTRNEVFAGYRELQPFLGHCKFRDCQHEHEPGCVIQQMIAEKKMAKSRILSLFYILNTITLD